MTLKTKLFTGLAVVGLAAGLAAPTFAQNMGWGDRDGFRPQLNQNQNWQQGQRPELTDEQKAEREARRAEHEARRAEVEVALESGDYAAFQAATADAPGSMHDFVTAENFATFAAMHAARQAGDFTKAQELATELGLPARGGQRGERGEHGGCRGSQDLE